MSSETFGGWLPPLGDFGVPWHCLLTLVVSRYPPDTLLVTLVCLASLVTMFLLVAGLVAAGTTFPQGVT